MKFPVVPQLGPNFYRREDLTLDRHGFSELKLLMPYVYRIPEGRGILQSTEDSCGPTLCFFSRRQWVHSRHSVFPFLLSFVAL